MVKFKKTITKLMIEHDMYELKLSRNKIAEKYGVKFNQIKKIQKLYKLQILNCQGEKVPRSLSKKQKQIIIGSVLGLGKLEESEWQHSLSVKHKLKESSYLDYKFEELKDFVRTYPTIQLSNMEGKMVKCKSFKTLGHDYFSFINSLSFEQKIEKLEEEGLSILYSDLGSVRNRCRDFCFGLPKTDHDIFCFWIKENFGIKAKPIRFREGFKSRVYDWEAFDNIVEPYLIDCMRYKIQKGKNVGV